MQVRILKKNRKLRAMSVIAAMTVMIVSFQNCAPPAKTDSSSTSPSSGSSGSSSKSPYQNNNNLVIGGGGSGSSSSGNNGVITIGGGGSGSSSGGSSSSGGGSSSSGGNGTIVVGGGGAAGNGALSISKQPQSISVYEKGDFTFEVGVTGGKYPYSYQWYKDGAPLSNGLGTYAFFTDNADRWSKEGVYYVTIKDATGSAVSSQSVRLGIIEPPNGCAAGSYFTFTNATYDQAYGYFSQYLDGPRGKYLLHQSYDTANFLFQFSGYTGLSSWSFPAIAYLGKAAISCKSIIPRIRGSYNSCATYSGSVNFECHNNKLKFISDTCQVVEDNCGGGGGGN